MAQFQVPQFIEIEDKIVGPLTLRQFIYLAVAGLLSFLLFFVIKTWLWFIITTFLGTIAAILAFVKYNGQPMHVIILSALKYLWRPRFYLWQRPEIKTTETAGQELKIPKMPAEIPIEEKQPPLLKSLWLKIQTGAQSIKPLSPAAILHKFHKKEERFEILRKITGEKEKARRIDYR